MLKFILVALCAIVTFMALVFLCACVVGGRYEKGMETSEQYEK